MGREYRHEGRCELHAAEMQERTVEILEHTLGRLEATTAQSWTA
jgi:hypothetical protein